LCAATIAISFHFARSPLHTFLARRQYNLAQSFLAAGRLDEASVSLREALRWKPAFAEARGQLGALELQRGHLEQAFLEFQSLAELQPESADGWLGLGQVRVAAGQPAEAEAAFSRMLELAPDRGVARVQRSELRYQLGRYRGALLDAQRAVRDDPRNARAWVALAQATARMKGNAAGLEEAEHGVASVGRDPALLRELALLHASAASSTATIPPTGGDATDRAERWPGALGALMRDLVSKIHQQDWNAALELATSARRAYPGTLMGPWLEGVVELSRGQLASAEKSLFEALAVAPRSHRPLTNLVAVFSRGGPLYTGDRLVAIAEADRGFDYPLPIAARAYLEADQPARAEATARLAFSALPSSVIPYRELVALYLELDRGSDALEICEQGLARFPDDPELQLQTARASVLLGDRERAISSYEHFLSKWNDDQVAASELAAMLLEARTDAASHRRALEIVRDLEFDAPNDPKVLATMGWVYLKVANDPQRAQQYLTRALRDSPEDASLHFRLAVARQMAGSPEEARSELRAALKSGHSFPEESEALRMLRELGDAH
jgi:cellulose synthase operon protein C